MKKITIALLFYSQIVLVLLFIVQVKAQLIGNKNKLSDSFPVSVKKLDNNDYFLFGQANGGFGGSDGYISIHDSVGNFITAKFIGGVSNDFYKSAIATNDKILVAGSTNSFGSGNFDCLVSKIDFAGSVLWTKVFGNSAFEEVKSLAFGPAGSIFAGGSTTSFGAVNKDILLSLFDSSGNLTWGKIFGENLVEDLNTINTLNDGSLILTGTTSSFGGGYEDIFVMNISESGVQNWGKTVGGNLYEEALSTIVYGTSIYICGWTESFGVGLKDILLSKFDITGNHIWTKVLGTTSLDKAYDLKIDTSDNTLLIAGFTATGIGTVDDMLLLKINNEGELVWQERLYKGYDQYGNNIFINENKYFIAGTELSPDWKVNILEFDKAGNVCYDTLSDLSIESVNPQLYDFNFNVTDITSSMIITSITSFMSVTNEIIPVSVCFLDTIISVPEINIRKSSYKIFPNPNNGIFTISSIDESINAENVYLEIFDITGRMVFKRELYLTQNPDVEINLSCLDKGLYLIKISDPLLFQVLPVIITREN